MRKIAYVMIIMILLLTACGKVNDVKNENVLSMNLVEEEQIVSIKYVQGKGTMRHSVTCKRDDSAEDIDAIMNVFSKVSSDGEGFENYKLEGCNFLYFPSIEIVSSSGDEMIITWEMQEGKLVYGDETYYISTEHAKDLYDIFTKYNPYMNGKI